MNKRGTENWILEFIGKLIIGLVFLALITFFIYYKFYLQSSK